MENEKLIQIIACYKQALADAIEENFIHKVTIKELESKIQELTNNKEEK